MLCNVVYAYNIETTSWPGQDLDWESGNDTCPEPKGFDLVHRRPQIGMEVGMANLFPSAHILAVQEAMTNLFGNSN